MPRGYVGEALESYKTALPLVGPSTRPAALAVLKSVVGETLRKMGQLAASVSAYREAIADLVQAAE